MRKDHTTFRVCSGLGLVALCITVASTAAEELQERAAVAYREYAESATKAFVDRIGRSTEAAPHDTTLVLPRGDTASVVAGPAREDGIIDVPGGLVHHWAGKAFIPRVTLDRTLDVSRAYDDYPRFYKSVLASTTLSRQDASFHVRFRIKEGAAGVSAVLDIQSTVQYFRPRVGHAYAISVAEEIREVVNAGRASERTLPPGMDSGYLWRATTLTSFVQQDGGVHIEMETIGLSRRFPRFLGWLIEPIARRLGRKSVETSLEEFRAAVALGARSPLTGGS